MRADGEQRHGEDRQCTETNRVSSISSDGRVNYEVKCTDRGLRTYSRTEAPVTIAAVHAGAIAAGCTVHFHCIDDRQSTRTCFPDYVWSSAKKDRLVGFLGAAL